MFTPYAYDKYLFPLDPGQLEALITGETFQKALQVSGPEFLNHFKQTKCCEKCAISVFNTLTDATKITSIRLSFFYSAVITSVLVQISGLCFLKSRSASREAAQSGNGELASFADYLKIAGVFSLSASIIAATFAYKNYNLLTTSHTIVKAITNGTL